MLGQIAAKIGFKAIGAAGSALYGAASAVSKTGQAFGMAGKALSGAAQGGSTQAPASSNNVIVGNFGMAGSAGRQKISGGGTLPAPKSIARPQVSSKMPTEALLDTAVKYLVSIDKSLKSQLEFERRSYQEQNQLEREAIVENKPATTFRDIKDRLSGLKSDVKDNVSAAASIAKFALILGGAAALIAGAMDQKEIDALKENVEQFKKTFGWLGELGSMIPAGGIIGFLFGGKGLKGRLRGGLIGILAEAVAATVFNRMTGQGGGDNTAVNLAATAGIGYLGFQGAKSAIGLSRSISTVRGTGAAMQAATGFAGKRAAVSAVAADSAKTGMAFLKGPMWKKFLAFLMARGKKELVRKIEQRIAIAIASGAVAATGIGAAFGAIGFLINLGFSLWLMYDIYQMWKEFTASDDADKAGVGDAEISKELNKEDATKISGTAVSSNAQTPVAVSNQAILETIRMKESGNDYGAQNPESTASGAYQFIDATWQALTNKYGIGTEYSKAKQAPPAIQDAVADKYVSEILQDAGGDVSKVPVAWYTGNIRGISNHASPQQVASYQSDWLRVYNGGKPDINAATNTFSGDSGSTGISGMIGAGAEKMGEMFGLLGSSIIKPGVAKTLTPSSPNVSERINNESTKLQNDITFGIKKEKAKDTITSPTISAGVPRGASPTKSVSSIDPNYGNPDVLAKYLSHFRLA